jgi:carboxymethylenebutenolidase
MRFISKSFLTFLFVVFHHTANAQEPRQLTDTAVSPAVWGVLEIPVTPGPHPAVVILHGGFGWRPIYPQYAKSLADSGFVALAIDYYAVTGKDTSRQEKLLKWPQWQATVRNAVAFLQTLPSASGKPVGLVGFSRGAFLAVSVASSTPSVGAVVDFFGGGGGGTDSLEQEVRHFPPILILHGEADSLVPVSFAHRLREAVIAQGGEVEMHLYPGGQHAFNATFSPSYLESAASDSFKRTIDFLRRRLTN